MTITERLQGLPVFQGLYIPYSVVIDANGVPDFKATDMERWWLCVKGELCAICGKRLDYWVWYIGGLRCAEEGIYFDLGMHEECCFYSASVCPFIAKARGYAAAPPKLPLGYERIVQHEVKRTDVMYASKRRRGVKVIENGDGWVVKVGGEVDRVQIGARADEAR